MILFCIFLLAHWSLRKKRKIIYLLTPPPWLSNIGDHAQVIAIKSWIKKVFPSLPIIEVDEDQTKVLLPALKLIVNPRDIFFLQGGGNMNQNAWVEKTRRRLISTFLNNRIISLPQTIYFSNTPKGESEKEETARSYNTHPDLTVISRDPYSQRLACKMFPNARTFAFPDFALSISSNLPLKKNNSPKVLLCLRNDGESILTHEQRSRISDLLDYEYTTFNTVIKGHIKANKRIRIVMETLSFFNEYDIVITDRFHGVIFAVLCKKPCVALPTFDHKITYGISWFRKVQFIKLAGDLTEIPSLVEEVLSVRDRSVPDWNKIYFDNLAKLLGLN